MVNISTPLRASVRCREIDSGDLDAIVDLLTRGFPKRQPSYWKNGLTRMAAAQVPLGYPRFGFLLEHAGAPVGVVLTLYHQSHDENGIPSVRCNLSSWYVEAGFRSYATRLVLSILQDKTVTFTTISPARSTWQINEVMGHKKFAEGHYFSLPLLSHRGHDVRVMPFATSATPNFNLNESDERVLQAHQALGCLCLVAREPAGDLPFVFIPFTIRAGRVRLPAVRLIYCRDLANLAACAGGLGRYFLRRGIVSIVTDFDRKQPMPFGFYARAWGRKYFKGPKTPRLGDLAYSELVVFGP